MYYVPCSQINNYWQASHVGQYIREANRTRSKHLLAPRANKPPSSIMSDRADLFRKCKYAFTFVVYKLSKSYFVEDEKYVGK